MESIISNVANIGFPIVLSIYLLLRFESKIEELTVAINDLSIVINKNIKDWLSCRFVINKLNLTKNKCSCKIYSRRQEDGKRIFR